MTELQKLVLRRIAELGTKMEELKDSLLKYSEPPLTDVDKTIISVRFSNVQQEQQDWVQALLEECED